MFAEDIGILPNRLFLKLLDAAVKSPESFEHLSAQLFTAMRDKNGFVGFERVPWFNGGLFDSAETLPLSGTELKRIRAAAKLDWSDIDPSIFGTLFERGLDPEKRSQLGAHYTDTAKIEMLLEPLLRQPLEKEWEDVRQRIMKLMDTYKNHQTQASRTKAFNQAEKLSQNFLKRLNEIRVLDPACGSGNFLYLALKLLKDFEHQVILEIENLGLNREIPQVGPQAVLGLEISPYAAELARVTVWIGEIQWMKQNGFEPHENPILRPLNNIQCVDSLLIRKPHPMAREESEEGNDSEELTVCHSRESGNPEEKETDWPETDIIVVSPPFLGDKKLLGELGETYTSDFRKG